MKFAHLADCHIGGWREPKMQNLGILAFVKAVDSCIAKKVDFIIISGDLFNTPLPAIEGLKNAVMKLKEAKDKGIPVYVVGGSHDYSASGKTMLDVLEHAGLFVNVFRGSINDGVLKLRFTHDPKTDARITGIIGKRAMLDKRYYEKLDKSNLENEKGFKIFVFHTAIAEITPKEFQTDNVTELNFLPKGFDYYAGGHVHIIAHKNFDNYKNVVYPGALFPNNFSELEKFKQGGFYLYNEDELNYEPIIVCNVESLIIDCNNKNPLEIKQLILDKIKNKEFNNTIVTMRLFGTLDGKVSDIDFREIFDILYGKSAIFVMKNTNGLQTKEFGDITASHGSVDEIEEELINKHMGKIKIDTNEKELTKQLMHILSSERFEGETVSDFEKRVLSDVDKTVNPD